MAKKRLKGNSLIAEQRPMGFVSNLIFFLNIVVALLIITGAWLLIETEFGRNSMMLGFLMLCISVLMKAVHWW